MSVLDLGCGWGSCGLYLLKKYPKIKVTFFSNSKTQQEYIRQEAKKGGNEKRITSIEGDVNVKQINDAKGKVWDALLRRVGTFKNLDLLHFRPEKMFLIRKSCFRSKIFSAKRYFFGQKYFIHFIILYKNDFFSQKYFSTPKWLLRPKNIFVWGKIIVFEQDDFFEQKCFFQTQNMFLCKIIFLSKNDFFSAKKIFFFFSEKNILFFHQEWFFQHTKLIFFSAKNRILSTKKYFSTYKIDFVSQKNIFLCKKWCFK